MFCFPSLALLLLSVDQSSPPILQWFESSHRTMERRVADVFLAGYGFVWVPPPFRADISNYSVGYDVYDRFDLGQPDRPTLYGTENGLKSLARTLHRAGLSLHVDFVLNHAGFSKLNTPGFVKAGGYPGLAITLPRDIDGDFHSAYDYSEQGERLKGLVDIAHEKNHRLIRNPVGPDARNIPAGRLPAFGRLANQPDPSNRRFYPQQGYRTIFLFDALRGAGGIPKHSFNLDKPELGTPVVENAMGYLMRNAQWLVQAIGVDGLRLDAAKHVTPAALQSLDRAVYRTNPRLLLDGSPRHVFSYSEVYEGNPATLLPHVRKDINPADPGRIGGNRDTLDFNLYFALRDGLGQTGLPNAWSKIRRAGLDLADDGLHNGSAGVTFTHNHDVPSPYALPDVAQAYALMLPGNTVVYYNGQEFGDNRDFPLAGRGDALANGFLRNLLEARRTHGIGNFAERWAGADGLYAYEREGASLVLLSNRGDAGFDSRTLTNLGFRNGALLVELSGNAQPDIPKVLRVFEQGGVRKVNVRFARNRPGRGVLVYGLATPESAKGIEMPDVTQTDRFEVVVKTRPVKLLGSANLRDVDADGDRAVLKLDAGVDLNGDGKVDYVKAGTLDYGFERFRTKDSPLLKGGDGEFRQQIDARKLEEGQHFLTVRIYRRQPAGAPPVFREYRKVFVVDRRSPECTVTGTLLQCEDDTPETVTVNGVALPRLDPGLYRVPANTKEILIREATGRQIQLRDARLP